MTPYTYGDNNEMTAAGSETWTYDHFGNAKTKVVSGNTSTFGWDFESHLLSVDYPGTSNDDTHEYDGSGLRMRSKLAGAANWTNFIWDELTHELLAEYTLISGTYTIKALNTYGLGLLSSNREGTKRYFHFDALGNTAALDDENENLKDSYTYESFGVVVTATSTNGPSVNPFRFGGQSSVYDDGAMGSGAAFVLIGSELYAPQYGRGLSGNQAVGLFGVECTKEWNERIYQFCNDCYRRQPPDAWCRIECDRLAREYFRKCGKWIFPFPGGPGPGPFKPPPDGGEVAPRPTPGSPTGPGIRPGRPPGPVKHPGIGDCVAKGHKGPGAVFDYFGCSQCCKDRFADPLLRICLDACESFSKHRQQFIIGEIGLRA